MNTSFLLSQLGYSFFAREGKTLAVICVLILASVLIAWTIIEAIENRRYKRFVGEHSVRISCLRELNRKYSFRLIASFDMKHNYDNEHSYSDVSPSDYLIYQLQYIKTDVRNAISDCCANQRMFSAYQLEFEESQGQERYDVAPLPNLKKLEAIEEKLIKELYACPALDFSITVNLYLTNMGGRLRAHKSCTFYIDEIEWYLKDLQEKSGNFYLNDNIWHAICRVERGKVSNKMRFAVYNRDGYRCRNCGRKTSDLEIDHIFPISKGGKSNFDNLQTLCHWCNAEKSNYVVPWAVAPTTRKTDDGINRYCDVCGAPLIRRKGKYGDFYGCSNYPNCKFTKKL